MNPFLDEELSEESPPWNVLLDEWTKSRCYWHLLAGLPALVALVAMLALGGFTYGWKVAHAEPDLRTLAERAFRGEDFETARVAYQSLLRLGGKESRHYAFQLMQAQYRLGRHHEGAVLALQLAPLQGTGYGPAHLYVAKAMLAQSNPPPAMITQAASHLERALKADPANTEARELLSQFYLASGELGAAKRHLLELAGTSGDAMLRLAALLDAEGDTSGSRHWAERAARHFRTQVERQGGDTPTANLAWASALLLLEDYPTAVQLLQQARRKTGNAVYTPALARLCADWAHWLARRKPADLATRFQAIQEGLDLDPQNTALIRQLARLTSLSGAEGERAREIVEGMMREGRNPGLLHFCLGGEAWSKGEREKAFEHFRLAYAVAPRMPLVANSMALTLTWQDQPELDRALAIAESLVQQNPRNPAFRDTRGQVLVKLGKTREALADLAYALPLMEDKAATHRALAECYRTMGMADLAEEHEAAARGPAATGGQGEGAGAKLNAPRAALAGATLRPAPTNAPPAVR